MKLLILFAITLACVAVGGLMYGMFLAIVWSLDKLFGR